MFACAATAVSAGVRQIPSAVNLHSRVVEFMRGEVPLVMVRLFSVESEPVVTGAVVRVIDSVAEVTKSFLTTSTLSLRFLAVTCLTFTLSEAARIAVIGEVLAAKVPLVFFDSSAKVMPFRPPFTRVRMSVAGVMPVPSSGVPPPLR